jgi:3-methylcrotonyl-CoA carboxylase alpha subunit
VGYVGAGTVEFIVEPQPDGDLRFYFMEMNTRLQVEHPVTEAVTGLDLVEWQLRVASGQPLPLKQHELKLRGHAIEARICAENPDAQFLPATGTLQVARWPDHVAFCRNADGEGFHDAAAVRVDSGFAQGDEVSPYYDSMIAKLIVWGVDREQALARLDVALGQTHLVGLHTNVAFLRRVVRSKAFSGADLDTALIERERAALFNAAPLSLELALAGLVAHTLTQEAATQTSDPWSRRDGWSLTGTALRRFDLEINGEHHGIRLSRSKDGAMDLLLGEQRLPMTFTQRAEASFDVKVADRRSTLTVYAQQERLTVFGAEASTSLRLIDPTAHAIAQAAEAASSGGRLTAPMPGRVISFLAQPGQAVKQGQALAVMEAMKMEHTINSPRDGTVAELLYAVGDQVNEGGELLTLA